MIKDSLKNADLYASVHPDFLQVFAYLKTLTGDEETQDIRLDGGCIKGCVCVEMTDNRAKKPMESHRKKLDIHFILKGEEDFGYKDIAVFAPSCEYNEEGDYILFDGEPDYVRMNEGDFL